jgi:cytochrome c-type biogenesis protein CcmH/NrfG
MKNQPTSKGDYIKKGNALIAVFCALVVGFIGGVALGVYKSMPSSGGIQSGSGSRIEDRSKMAAALEKEAAATPDSAAGWIQLGNLYYDADQHDEAIAAYRKALALAPGNADVWTDLGVMYRRKGQPRKAVEAFDQAAKVDPKHQASRFNKGVVLLHDLEDVPGAIAAWEELIRINPVATTPSGQSVDELLRHIKETAAREPAG